MNIEKVEEGLTTQKPFSFAQNRSFWLSALGLAVITGLVYLPLWNNDFLNTWDDGQTITDNIYIRSLSWYSIHWMCTTSLVGYSVPLTWLSLALDYQIDGLNPRVFHLTNLLFHIANTILVFGLCRKFLSIVRRQLSPETQLKKRAFDESAAFLTALLFAIHPIHVESVAWATERRDVLYAFFYLLSLWFYLGYAASARKPKIKLILSCILFGLSLMSKPMAITLPLMFWIFDSWPLGRLPQDIKKVFLEKIPFILTALGFTILNLYSLSKTNTAPVTSEFSVAFRLINAFHQLAFYVWKMIVPFHLEPLYPTPLGSDALYFSKNYFAVISVLAFSIFVFIFKTKKPYILTAWLCYLVMLLPVLGHWWLLQDAADRYTYLPSLAFFLPLSVGIVSGIGLRKWALRLLIIAVVTGLGWMTWNQLAIWKNSIALWESVVAVYPNVTPVAHTNLAEAYTQAGRLDDALRECDLAIAIPPPQIFPHEGKGMILLKKGLVEEAIVEFKKAIEIGPNYASPHRYLWLAYRKKGMNAPSISEIQKAIEMDPDFAENYFDLALSLRDIKRFDESEEAFKKALSLDPNNFNYTVNLALTYQITGHLTEALEWFQKGNALDPTDARCWFELGHTYLLMGQYARAVAPLQTAQKLDPTQLVIEKALAEARVKLKPISAAKNPTSSN